MARMGGARTWARAAIAGARVAVVAVVAAFAACGSDAPAGPPGGGGDGGGTLVVRAEASALLTGDTVALSVATPGGETVPVGQVTWSVADPAVARVTEGRLVGVAEGETEVRARRGDDEGVTIVRVWTGAGTRVPGMASYDRLLPELMARWGIEGGAVAVVKDGRLVYARSYGWSDPDAGEAVAPTDLFRVASVSKPVTAAAVLRLVEAGLLDLDQPAFALLSDLEPPAGAAVDPRLAGVTVRQLLLHAGGWDRDATFDPMFRAVEAAEALGAPVPASAETVIRYMMGQPLQFTPGARYAYSNLGYAILGRVIERVSGRAYDDFVRDEVLAPLGVARMEIGSSRLAGRLPDEVRYHDGAVAASVFPGEGQVPFPYGGFHLEAMDAHGAWVASTVDLLRFLTGVDGRPSPPDLLDPTTVAAMSARPPQPLWAGSAVYYGLGWLVRPAGSDANWWHDGSLPGTTALLVRNHEGVSWAALFNRRASGGGTSFAAELDATLWDARAGVTAWPDHDLFPLLP